MRSIDNDDASADHGSMAGRVEAAIRAPCSLLLNSDDYKYVVIKSAYARWPSGFGWKDHTL
jgi:beta-glucosidase-like glycosyl hydrolase